MEVAPLPTDVERRATSVRIVRGGRPGYGWKIGDYS